MRENCVIKSMKIVVYEKLKLLHCENEFLVKYRKSMIFVQNWNVYYCLKHGHVGT